MPKEKRRFKRSSGQRPYRRLFVIATEGTKTERQYFAIFNNHDSVIQVKTLKGNTNSSPVKVLKRMNDYLKQEKLNKSDQAWLVVDKDQWTDEQLQQLFTWSIKKDNYGFALSNPKFEYWLLLHFENGSKISTPDQCTQKLKKHLPGYDKSIDTHKITPERIDSAIKHASDRDKPPCNDWPRSIYGTTVYKLVKNIIGQAKYIDSKIVD